MKNKSKFDAVMKIGFWWTPRINYFQNWEQFQLILMAHAFWRGWFRMNSGRFLPFSKNSGAKITPSRFLKNYPFPWIPQHQNVCWGPSKSWSKNFSRPKDEVEKAQVPEDYLINHLNSIQKFGKNLQFSHNSPRKRKFYSNLSTLINLLTKDEKFRTETKLYQVWCRDL